MQRNLLTTLLLGAFTALSLPGCNVQHVDDQSLAESSTRCHEERMAQEWQGLWLFQKGYFSQTFAKKMRLDWTPTQFPDNPKKIGFDAGAGKYHIDGNSIQLDYDLTFYPGKTGRRDVITYHFDGDILTFTQPLVPHRESAATGQRTTVLRKLY